MWLLRRSGRTDTITRHNPPKQARQSLSSPNRAANEKEPEMCQLGCAEDCFNPRATLRDSSSLLTNYQATAEMRMSEQLEMLSEVVAGCSERPSSKAAASGEARRTLAVR